MDLIVTGLSHRLRRGSHSGGNEYHDRSTRRVRLVGIARPLEQGQNTLRAGSLVESKQEESTYPTSREEQSTDAFQDHVTGCVGHLLNSDGTYFFTEARHNLVTHRDSSHLRTMFANVGLFGALVGAFIKAWETRDQTYLSRTVPMVIMSFHLIATVQLSTMTGALTSPCGPLIVNSCYSDD